MIVDTNNICTYCGVYIPFGAGTLLTRIHSKIVSAIKAAVIIKGDLDCYGHADNGSHFCKSGYGMIFEKKITKFGSANYINVSPCQKYPDILSYLTTVKEVFITHSHSIMLWRYALEENV